MSGTDTQRKRERGRGGVGRVVAEHYLNKCKRVQVSRENQ